MVQLPAEWKHKKQCKENKRDRKKEMAMKVILIVHECWRQIRKTIRHDRWALIGMKQLQFKCLHSIDGYNKLLISTRL